MLDALGVSGEYGIQLYRDEKLLTRAERFRYKENDFGQRLIKEDFIPNTVKTAGKNHFLDVTFGKGSPLTQINPWHFGLIKDTPAPSPVIADTMASHSGWLEATGYTGARQIWVDADSSAGAKATTSAAVFPITATDSLWGIFLTELSPSGVGDAGVLWNTGQFTAVIPVVNTDTVNVTYTING